MTLLIDLKTYKIQSLVTKWKKGTFETEYIKKTKTNNGTH